MIKSDPMAEKVNNKTADEAVIETNTVRQCVEHISSGAMTSEELVLHHAAQIEKTDGKVKAWQSYDKEKALRNATMLDDIRKRGEPTGALHGVPVGIKDIYDTKDYPTEYGSAIHAGRQPDADCRVVEKLKEAGAIVMGKTVTTEFAFMHPSKTTNPHNADYSPGGSSSGSAASVAAGHVSLAIGSQTNGSVLRPASFCGVYGFKPSRGVISRRGALETSPTLDQVGVFGRDVGDIALLVDTLAGYDAADTQSYMAPKPSMLAGYLSDAPVPPTLAWIDMPYANRYSEDVIDGFKELFDELEGMVERVPAPESFAALIPCHKIIHEFELARCLKTQINQHWNDISDTIKPMLENAKTHSDASYREALEIRSAAIDWFTTFFHDYDAVLTPSALAEAPKMGSTGDPVCCTVWTLCGLPCISLPLLSGSNSLPIGVQLVGALQHDDRLLRTTRHVLQQLHANS